MTDDGPRPWHSFSPLNAAVLLVFGAVVLGILGLSGYRRQVGRFPEVGHATPRHVLDAAEAAAKADEMPLPHPTLHLARLEMFR